MKTGTSGSVRSMTPAVMRSIAATHASTTIGTTEAKHELREVPGEVGLESLDALHRGCGHLARLDPVERERLVAEPAPNER